MRLKHRLWVFAALGPAAAFGFAAMEIAAAAGVMAATGLGPPLGEAWASLAMAGRGAVLPLWLILFATPAALAAVAVDMAERHERTRPILALAACGAAVTLLSMLPGFLVVLAFANPFGGVLGGLIAGAGAALACWVAAPPEAPPAEPEPPRPIVVNPYAYRPDQPASAFGRR